jgi:hypothetical protein
MTPDLGKPLVPVAREQLSGGVAQIALAIGFGVIALGNGHRPIANAAAFAFEAAFFGGFMWRFSLARLRRDVEAAPEIVDPAVRDNRTQARSLVLRTTVIVPVLAAITLTDPGSPIVAGIALGAGADSLAFHRWLLRWESDHSAEVLRLPVWRRRKDVNEYRISRTTSR